MIETLSGLVALMKSYGAVRFYAKKLAPNDNSKNQVYLGGDFSVLNIIPHQGIYTDDSSSAGSVRNRARQTYRFHGWTKMAGKMLPIPSSFFIPNIPKSGCPVF